MKTTWILIASSSEARLFQKAKNSEPMELIQEFHHPESREKAANLVSDQQGRYRNWGPKSAFEDESSPKQVEASKFAHELAAKLNEGRTKNRYKHLVLIAPAHFQGLLNKCCNDQVKTRIIKVLDKDYTKLKQHLLLERLNGHLHIPLAA